MKSARRWPLILVAAVVVAGCAPAAEDTAETHQPDEPIVAVVVLVTVSPVTARQLTPQEEAVVVELAYGSFAVDVSLRKVVTGFTEVENACFDIGAINVGAREDAPSSLEFSMVTPSGRVHSAWPFMPTDMHPDASWGVFPRVVPGAGTSTVLCFWTDDERGQFTVRYNAPGETEKAWPVSI